MTGNMWGSVYTGQQAQNGVMTIFVNGEASASAHPVAAGNTVNLVDLDGGKMWFKSTDVNGMPCPLRTFEIKEITPQPVNADMVSRKEFNDLSQQLQNLQQLILKATADRNADKQAGGKVK